MAGGLYYYFGITKTLQNTRYSYHLFYNQRASLNLSINVDGLLLFESSTRSFWPILGSFEGYPVFIIGIWLGNGKPSSSNEFLKDFSKEVTSMINNSITINDKRYNFNIKNVIADALAKSFLFNTKGHTGFSSCIRCRTVGKSSNHRIFFKDCEAEIRTIDDFIATENNKFCGDTSLLVHIPNFNVTKCIPFDYMQLVCYGMTKRSMEL